jgi:hypothetical protein
LLNSIFLVILKGTGGSTALPDNWPLILATSLTTLAGVIVFGTALDIWLKRILN